MLSNLSWGKFKQTGSVSDGFGAVSEVASQQNLGRKVGGTGIAQP